MRKLPRIPFVLPLRFFKKHVVTEESRFCTSAWSYTERAVYDKMLELPELPEDKDAEDSTDEDEEVWLERYQKMKEEEERYQKVKEEEALMVKEEMAVEDGWWGLPFAPELQPLSRGVFLATSVSYSWPGYVPGGLEEEVLCWEFLRVPKVGWD